jgi:flavin reductase (DIM6/NTAB) family NADH-FMN oxidoreductase RutF
MSKTLGAPPESASRMDAENFKAAFRNHPAGVAAVTADAGKGPVGLTATSVISVSAEPPLLAFSLSNLSSSSPAIMAADTVVVHLLSADEVEIAKLCSTSGIDRFADLSIWSRLETGEPYFTNVRTRIRGEIVERVSAGSSTIVVVRALEAEASHASSPLVYHNRTWHRVDDLSQI